MPECTLVNQLPYIPGSYHKTTTFVNKKKQCGESLNVTNKYHETTKPSLIEENDTFSLFVCLFVFLFVCLFVCLFVQTT